MEFYGGLKWKRIAPNGADVHAGISVSPDASAFQWHVAETRDYMLRNHVPPPPLTSLRRSNFHLEKVRLTTRVTGSTLEHRFTFLVGDTPQSRQQPPDFSCFNLWKLSFNAGNRTFLSKFDIQDDVHPPRGMTAVAIRFDENTPSLRGQPSHLTGPFSIDDGWPQDIRIELPQGLPATPGTVSLPFCATLAPLPK